ncbi:MAG: DNA recombination protein RmuC [Erysipelotrichaceae bacterium]
MSDTFLTILLGVCCLLCVILIIVMLKQQQNHKQLAKLQEQQNIQELAQLKAMLEVQQQNTMQGLQQIQHVVDERLEQTLNTRLQQNAQQVQTALDKVHLGLGEMQKVASGVERLQDVLMNVKTRGILGEIQLFQLVEDILTPSQYVKNVATIPGSRNMVECAILLEDGVMMPIDAKFPLAHFERILDATSDAERSMAQKNLVMQMRNNAKDIRSKYIEAPYTTDFGILFVPVESLYLECLQLQLGEILHQESKIILAGPSTLSAILNALAFGFKRLVMETQAKEIYETLAKVQKEFDSFAIVLDTLQNRLQQANSEMDKLVGVRTRKIQAALANLSEKGSNL